MEVYHTWHLLRKTTKQIAVDGVTEGCWFEETRNARARARVCGGGGGGEANMNV